MNFIAMSIQKHMYTGYFLNIIKNVDVIINSICIKKNIK